MPNVGDIIRAEDFNGAGIKAGAVVPFYNVTLSGRYPIFWGESEADTGWLVCDGGSDLHGGNVPNLINKFIMGTNTVSGANKTGGATTTSSTSTGGTVGATTITSSTSGSHQHYIGKIFTVSGGTPGYQRYEYPSVTTYSAIRPNIYTSHYAPSTISVLSGNAPNVNRSVAQMASTIKYTGQVINQDKSIVLASSYTYGVNSSTYEFNISSCIFVDNNVGTWAMPTSTGTGGSGSHTHSFTGSSHTHTITPPYYTLIYCVKLP